MNCDTGPVDGPLAYEVRGLVRTFGASGRKGRAAAEPVLANDHIDLDIAAGAVFGLLGPNGAGKTTLVRQLVGLLRPDEGTIRLLGAPLDARAGACVGYLPQHEAALADLTVSLAIESTGRLRGLGASSARSTRDALVEELGLAPLVSRVIGQLSGGERRLAAFGAALAGPRPILVLDEPTTGLDPQARRAVWTALERRRREAGMTVVLVTHNVLEAESVLDRVAVLDAGRVIACDTPGRLKAQVSDEVRLDLVWRGEPPGSDPVVAALAARATVTGRRWSVHLPVAQAREALGSLTSGPAFAALDDFTLATPTLEDVYLALGGRARDLERA
ncbi:MAG: ABC transporter ATP-binding protein [Actinomycetes bacterium]